MELCKHNVLDIYKDLRNNINHVISDTTNKYNFYIYESNYIGLKNCSWVANTYSYLHCVQDQAPNLLNIKVAYNIICIFCHNIIFFWRALSAEAKNPKGSHSRVIMKIHDVCIFYEKWFVNTSNGYSFIFYHLPLFPCSFCLLHDKITGVDDNCIRWMIIVRHFYGLSTLVGCWSLAFIRRII